MLRASIPFGENAFGSLFKIAAIVSPGVSPSNGEIPVTITSSDLRHVAEQHLRGKVHNIVGGEKPDDDHHMEQQFSHEEDR